VSPTPIFMPIALFSNCTYDGQEQAWKAATVRTIMRDAPYFEAAFHARLSKAVADLGYAVERTAKGWEVADVAPEVLSRFSRRTQLIEGIAKAKGITSAKEKDKLGSKSREKKNEGESLQDLRAEWEARLSNAERDGIDSLKANAANFAAAARYDSGGYRPRFKPRV